MKNVKSLNEEELMMVQGGKGGVNIIIMEMVFPAIVKDVAQTGDAPGTVLLTEQLVHMLLAEKQLLVVVNYKKIHTR